MYGREYLDAMDLQATQRKARAIVDAIPADLREQVLTTIIKDREKARCQVRFSRLFSNAPGGVSFPSQQRGLLW